MKQNEKRLLQGMLQHQGFTLIELAIVLIILSFMLAMFLGPLGTQREVRARAETTVLIEQAREALLGYAVVNGHLPCPDVNTPPNGLEGARTSGVCDNDQGVLPWATLGIKGFDAWGRYFNYGVHTTFSNSTSLFNISDAEGVSNINVLTAASGGTKLVSNNSRPAAIIFSHGANGHGAWTNTGTQLALPSGADEVENTDGNLTYVSHTPTPEDGGNAFDDIVIWISPKVLVNRMITAGRLP